MKKRGFNLDIWMYDHTRSHVSKVVKTMVYVVDDMALRLKFLVGDDDQAENVENTWLNAIFVRGMPW